MTRLELSSCCWLASAARLVRLRESSADWVLVTVRHLEDACITELRGTV